MLPRSRGAEREIPTESLSPEGPATRAPHETILSGDIRRRIVCRRPHIRAEIMIARGILFYTGPHPWADTLHGMLLIANTTQAVIVSFISCRRFRDKLQRSECFWLDLSVRSPEPCPVPRSH